MKDDKKAEAPKPKKLKGGKTYIELKNEARSKQCAKEAKMIADEAKKKSA